jgi:multidrug efflux pump subunit AcrB
MQPIEPETPKASRYLDDDAVNPYRAPTAPTSGLKPLGSLAQSARLKELNTARYILFFVGVVTIAINAYQFSNAEDEVDQVIQAEMAQQGPGMEVDPAARDQFIGIVKMIYGGAVALGVVFLVLGAVIKKYPVPATVLGLVLYLAGTGVFAFLDPASLARGAILKIIFIVALVKAVQTAFAYRREQREQALAEGYA